jgi:hypothetical protein
MDKSDTTLARLHRRAVVHELPIARLLWQLDEADLRPVALSLYAMIADDCREAADRLIRQLSHGIETCEPSS